MYDKGISFIGKWVQEGCLEEMSFVVGFKVL